MYHGRSGLQASRGVRRSEALREALQAVVGLNNRQAVARPRLLLLLLLNPFGRESRVRPSGLQDVEDGTRRSSRSIRIALPAINK